MIARRVDGRLTTQWLGSRVERLSSERRRELIEAATARSRISSGTALARLRDNLWPLMQTAVAASLAWLVAGTGFGHSSPVFAPVAAIVALGATRGQRSRRAVELILGVALGITAGDLLTRVIGVGVLQLGVIVALAMAAATFLSGGLLLLSETGVSATLVATVAPTTQGFPPSRLIDVLIGGTIALLFSQVLFPVHPVKLVREAAEAVVRELSDTLRAIAWALERASREDAEAALIKARRISAVWSRFEQALDVGGEAAQFAPARRRLRGTFTVYRDIGMPLDLIVGDVNVLARAAVRALMLGDKVPSRLICALEDLAKATDLLAGRIGDEQEDPTVRATALRAVYAATGLAPSTGDVSTSILIGYAQATGADLLRAIGLDREPAYDKVGRAADAASRRASQAVPAS